MSKPASSIRRLRSDERGFALTEVLVACGIGIVVLFIPLVLIQEVFSSADKVQSRVAAVSSAQGTLAPLVGDLRNATAATIDSSGGSATATLQVPVRSAAGGFSRASTTVVWTCTAGATCTRRVGTGPAVPYVQGVTQAAFTATGAGGSTALPQVDPVYVGISLKARVISQASRSGKTIADSTEPVTISDGVTLRNFT